MSSPQHEVDLPVDPDVEPQDRITRSARVRRLGRSAVAVVVDRWDILLVIGLGGSVGSVARWGVSQALTTAPGTFPTATFLVNVVGSFVLGVLMIFITDVWRPTRYVRPFFGVGVLGGFTTFSTYMLDTRSLLVGHHVELAAAYLFGTLLAGLLALWIGITMTRWALETGSKRRAKRRDAAGGHR
ncbi:MAG TPA: fluoride efflux transporter CrcB [Angustibacter sp.]|nr:fluoride efflux transporter CrcB [Angustibacter sp.]